MFYRITHSTRYVYPSPVMQCFSEAHLTPRALPNQRVGEHWLQVTPLPAFLQNRKDYFGNDVTTFAVLERHDRSSAVATSVVEVTPEVVEVLSSPAWEQVRDRLALPFDTDSIAASEFIPARGCARTLLT
jgi:transglutaminase-like putative cysteine protease